MYDTIIIGSGIAGLTAALYAKRGGLSTLVIKGNLGGQIINSNSVENYPGYLNVSGNELINNIKTQCENCGVEFLDGKVSLLKDINTVIVDGKDIKAKTIIIATGLKQRKLNVSGENELLGSGVSYCATCDGNFFKGKDVCVVGGGNTAIEDALYLSNIVNKVYVIHRRNTFRADSLLVEKLKNKSNVEFILNANVKRINGNMMVNEVVLDNGNKVLVNGVFIAIGLEPDNKFLNNFINIDEDGFIISNDTKTNISNIFVAGDIRKKDLRQLVTASSDGAMAASNAIKYIN